MPRPVLLFHQINAADLSFLFSYGSTLFFTPSACEGRVRDLCPLFANRYALFRAMEPPYPFLIYHFRTLSHAMGGGGWLLHQSPVTSHQSLLFIVFNDLRTAQFASPLL